MICSILSLTQKQKTNNNSHIAGESIDWMQSETMFSDLLNAAFWEGFDNANKNDEFNGVCVKTNKDGNVLRVTGELEQPFHRNEAMLLISDQKTTGTEHFERCQAFCQDKNISSCKCVKLADFNEVTLL